ncbi:MAG: STAS domain-containing protein [bacterium]
MSLSIKLINDILLLKIDTQRATVELSSEFKKELKKQIEKGKTKIVVDLSDAEFMDSSFLGALVTGLKQVRLKGGQLKIVGLQPPIGAMFELTRMNRIFEIFYSVEDALKNF